jgi:putative inorganic carbon (hco3(-)) transporter
VVGGRLTAGIGGPDFDDSSALAAHLVATLPLIGAAFFMARSWWGRGFALAVGALTVNTLVLTRTRNAIAGLAVVAVATVLSLPRGFRLKGLAAVVVGTLLAAQLADPAWWKRMRSVSDFENDSSATLRLTIWGGALRMAADYPLGIGLGNFHQTVLKYVPGLTDLRSAHNTLITCVTETGWLGLILLLTILGLVLWQLGGVRRTARDLPPATDIRVFRWQTRFHLGWHAVSLRAGLLGYLACAMFTTRLFAEDLWLLLGLAMCLDNVSKYMAAQEVHDPAEPARANHLIGVAPTPVPALSANVRDEVTDVRSSF